MTTPLACLTQRRPGLGYAYLEKDMARLVEAPAQQPAVDEAACSATFVITSNDPDRVGDVVEPQGIYLGNFARNPIGFFGHQVIPLPIGKWEDPQGRHTIVLEANRALGTLYFSQKTADAQACFALVSEGILRATSIGFNPLVEPIPRERGEANPNSLQLGYVYPRIDLLEVSVVGVPAQPTATLVRQHLERGRIGGEVISKALRRALLPLAEPKKATLFTGEATMSKKWGKSKSRKAAVEIMAGERAKAQRRKEGMAEGSGPAGGYATPEGDDAVLHEAQHRDMVKAIIGIMHRHKETAPPEGPHEAFYHPVKMAVHHQHAQGADVGHLGHVKEDLAGITGITEVTQHHELPPGEGYYKVYSLTEGHPEQPGVDPEEGEHPQEITPVYREAAAPGEDAAIDHRAVVKDIIGVLHLHKALPGGHTVEGDHPEEITPEVKDTLQECVSHKIPKLLAEGYSQDQAAAIAYSMCGEKALQQLRRKGQLKFRVKDEEPLGYTEDLADDEAEEPGGEELPLGAQCLQALVEHLSLKAPLIEQEQVKEFYDRLLAEAAELAEEVYPGLDLAGHLAEEGLDQESLQDTQEEANAEIEHYRKPPTERAARVGKTKQADNEVMEEADADALTMIKEAADHLHEHGDHDEGRPLTKKHKAAHRYHARRLDALAGQLKFSGHFESPVPAGPDGEEVLDTKEYEEGARRGLQEALQPLTERLYRLTGKKLNGQS